MSKRKKKPISGFSADYRSAYREPEEAENTNNLENSVEEPDDFLPETEENTTELLGEETEQEQEKTTTRRSRHHWYGVPVGVLVLLLALVGVGFIATTIGSQIYTAVTDDSKQREYDTFLSPVVMQDPKPFSSPDQADDEFVLNASLWKTITANNGTNYANYDDQGRAIVPLGDVVDACHDLFGPNCQLQPKTPTQETFYEYNSDANEFHVVLYSSDSSFEPYTESIKKQGDSVVLRVGYVSPSDAWRTQVSSTVTKPNPTKYMEYVLKTDPSTNKQYIYSVSAVQES
jgi:hypothetical protein